MNHHAVVLALISAALFGASTPAAKALLGAMHPVAALTMLATLPEMSCPTRSESKR